MQHTKRNAAAAIGSILRYSENDSEPEIGFAEIAIDLLQARFGIPSGLPPSESSQDCTQPRILWNSTASTTRL